MESIIESLEWTAEDELAARHQQHFFSFRPALPNGPDEEKKFVAAGAALCVLRME